MKTLKSKYIILGLLAVSMICLPCFASTKKIHERGWIGGQFIEVSQSVLKGNYFSKYGGAIHGLPKEIMQKQNGAVLVNQIYPNTPLSDSLIREGDVIFKIDEVPVRSMREFQKKIDKLTPGHKASFVFLRDGKIEETTVIIGRELYKKERSLSIFLAFSTELDLIPNPDFSIFSWIKLERNQKRVELNSPSYGLIKDNPNYYSEEENGYRSFEGFNFHIMPFGFGVQNIILSQDKAV